MQQKFALATNRSCKLAVYLAASGERWITSGLVAATPDGTMNVNVAVVLSGAHGAQHMTTIFGDGTLKQRSL